MTQPTQDNVALAQQMYMSQKKDPTMYLILALLLGGLGIHHFYVGNSGMGIMFLLFCWTFIPAIIAVVNAINCKKNVQAANLELANKIAVNMNVPVGELTKLAMI